MQEFALADYDLLFSSNYKSLTATHKSDPSQNCPFDLDAGGVEIKVENGSYWISDPDDGDWFESGFDVLNGYSFSINGSTGGGIGAIDIRDIGKADFTLMEVTFYLNQCSFQICYESGVPFNLRIKSPCSDPSSCTEIDPNCVVSEEIEA